METMNIDGLYTCRYIYGLQGQLRSAAPSSLSDHRRRRITFPPFQILCSPPFFSLIMTEDMGYLLVLQLCSFSYSLFDFFVSQKKKKKKKKRASGRSCCSLYKCMYMIEPPFAFFTPFATITPLLTHSTYTIYTSLHCFCT